LRDSPTGIGNRELEQFPEFREFRFRARDQRRAAGDEPRTDMLADVQADEQTPQDRIEAAVSEANAAVASDLLTRVLSQSPDFLERLVLQLLEAMGYTGSLGRTDHLGKTADEGVDGVVDQDALGLDRIYIQAKRYRPDRPISRPDVQSFVGALQGQQANRGVFITTSSFTREAREYVERLTQRVVLIDGTQLARLMIQHGVGVQPEQTVVLVKVDEDYFE
jgi:restriction system protein